eukprot:gene29004-35976_t
MSANHLATATDGSSVVSGASDSFMSSIVPSDDLRNRTHSLGSDTFTSFTSSANANNPIDTYDQKYGASNIGASAVSAKSARRKFKTSQQQQQQSSLSTFVPTAVRSASAPPSVATPQSKLHVSGASKRVKSRSTKHKPPQQSQHTVPPSSGTYSNSTWLASEQQQQQQLSGLNNLSYQSILQQNSSLVPPAMMSAALETSYLSAGSSGNAALNNSSYSRDSYHNPVVGQFVGSQGHTYHQSPSPQHTALSGGPGRPPRHPSSSTPENTFSGPPPPPSSAARRVGQPSGGAPVSLQARVDTWTQPTASPYSLPAYTAYDRSGSRAKGYTPPPTHSRVSGSAKSSSVRSNKTKSSRLALSTATPPSSARKIHVSVPSPATTFVGTKYDIYTTLPPEEIEEIDKLARKYAKAMKAPLIFSSASHSINVQKLFKIVLSKVFDLKSTVAEIVNVGEPLLIF